MSSTNALLLAYFTTGFTIGFGHCIGMCGPLVVSFSLRLKDRNILIPQLLYHSGRILTYSLLGGIMGAEVTEKEKTVAYVLCAGSDSVAMKKYLYNGVYDCISADLIGGGDKTCSHGCLGLGSCVAACQFDAIVIEDGLARIIPEDCVGCNACVSTCPKGIIKMIPAARAVHVTCSSLDKGPATLKRSIRMAGF